MLPELEIALGIYILYVRKAAMNDDFPGDLWIFFRSTMQKDKTRPNIEMFHLYSCDHHQILFEVRNNNPCNLIKSAFCRISMGFVRNIYFTFFFFLFQIHIPGEATIYLHITNAARYSKARLRELIFTRHIVSIFSHIDFLSPSLASSFLPGWCHCVQLP